ncbi:TetR/AcrR family transcriptional regulator [Clostridium beijerinckii]|uniref:TetR/AcrR family transcriptional regulator n=1 Tax=Clostridium beijerinckii TaxID=1520 RepID=UPI00080A4B75|nr:TetR/AcrR family transcriptional regulator [Clostridium beijerinckii]OCA97240.1 AcrR family transcriptional regulator [Clostridium beijerinckii]
MSRTNKDFDNKRNELLELIWDIFILNGYENTTLAFIIHSLNISKGAFYHYFSSKEECANASIEMKVKYWVSQISNEDTNKIRADEKLKKIILTGSRIAKDNIKQNEKIHSSSNIIFHQKLMVTIIKYFSPIYAKIICQGIEEGIFNVKYPLETAEMILTLSNFYLDANLFEWDLEKMISKVSAFEEVLTCALGMKENIFNFISKSFKLED